MAFLPMTNEEVKARGWDYVDFVYISGDAYVDHPSFGAAIITRVLEDKGFRVAVLSQPDRKSDRDFLRFGKPRLGFFISAGNIDSMVAHYTVAKRRRSDDAYSPGGKSGRRPDRAVTVYSQIVKRLFPDSPVIIGGLEASLRRFAHYDYWADRVMPSVLFDSGADILSYGMGELQTVEIAERLDKGLPIEALYDIRGICYKIPTKNYTPQSAVDLPSYERICESKRDYAIAARKELEEADAVRGRKMIQRHGKYLLVQNPPMPPLNTEQLDWVYSLPYERYYPECYEEMGGVPGIKEVEFSITHNRGCFGACNFCSLAFHQGRAVTVRSEQSVIDEAKSFLKNPRFKGYISDVGGPTANFRLPSCEYQREHGLCKNRKCLAPEPCKNLNADHTEYIHLLRELRKLDGIKRVFVRSGIRYDYFLADSSDEFLDELVRYHVSGQLRVAPEHCSDVVLDKMGKPHIEAYKRFSDKFYRAGRKGAVHCSLSYELAPWLYAQGSCRFGGFPQTGENPPRTGSGFLSHSGHYFHGNILHRARPLHAQRGLCSQVSRGKGYAARFDAVFHSQEPRNGLQGSEAGGQARPCRKRQKLPYNRSEIRFEAAKQQRSEYAAEARKKKIMLDL